MISWSTVFPVYNLCRIEMQSEHSAVINYTTYPWCLQDYFQKWYAVMFAAEVVVEYASCYEPTAVRTKVLHISF